MGSGRRWSKGRPARYLFVDWLFNNATEDQLKAFAKACRKPTTPGKDIFALQDKHLGAGADLDYAGVDPKIAEQGRDWDSRAFADAWYGNNLIWPGTNQTKPAEIERLLRATRCWIAERRIEQPRRTCRFFTQCYHDDFEVRITWPRGRLTSDSEMKVWVFVPVNVSTGDDLVDLDQDDNNAVVRPDVAAEREAQILAVRRARAEVSRVADAGRLELLEAERLLDIELAKMADVVARSLNGLEADSPIFQGTPEAMINVPGIDLVGGIEIRSLEELFDDPREHRLTQTPEERDTPSGQRASGISIRWNRSAAVTRPQLF